MTITASRYRCGGCAESTTQHYMQSGAVHNTTPWLVVATASDDLKRWRYRLQRMAYCVLECAESVRGIKQAIAADDDLYGAQLWQELTHEEQIALWVAPTKGGIFTTHERKRIRDWWNIQIPEAE